MTLSVVEKERAIKWTEIQLGGIIEYVTSGSRDWSKFYANSGAMFIRTQDINTNRLRLDNVARVKLPDKVEGKRTRIFKGDILITITGANVGKVALVENEIEEAYVSQSVALVRLKEPSFGRFLHYQLMAKLSGDKTHLEAKAYGLGRPVLNLDNIREVPIRFVQLEEQKRIVAEIDKQFSRLDEAVANLRRVKANLKRYKAAVLKAAVEGKLTEEWRKAYTGVEPASELLNRILAERKKKWEETELAKMKSKGTKAKDDRWKQRYQEPTPTETTDLPELPHGWTWASIEQLAIAEPNAIKAGPFGSALKKSFYAPKGYKIYGQEQVINGDPFYGDYYIDETRYNTLKSCAVKAGDILISLVGTIGRVLILPKGIEPGIINPRLVKLSLDPRLVSAEFIKVCIESPSVKQLFSLISHGGTMDVLNLTILKSIPFPLPSLKEQDVILQEIDRVSSIEKELEATISVNLLRAERLRQTVLMKAFSGDLLN